MQRVRNSVRRCYCLYKALRIFFVLFSCLTIAFLNSCAFSKIGKADVTSFEIKIPEGLTGLSKSEIIDRLGLPEGRIIDEKFNEYWAYNNQNRYFIVLFGQGTYKTLILKLEDNIVTNVRLIEKGASFGFLTGGM